MFVTPRQPNPQALHTTLNGRSAPTNAAPGGDLPPTYDQATVNDPRPPLPVEQVNNRRPAIVPAPVGRTTSTLSQRDLHHRLHSPRGELLDTVRAELQRALEERQKKTTLKLDAARAGLEVLQAEQGRQQRASAPSLHDVAGALFDDGAERTAPWLEQQIVHLEKKIQLLVEQMTKQASDHEAQLRALEQQQTQQRLQDMSPAERRKAQKLQLKQLKIDAKLRQLFLPTLN